ncbi:hypothetical protein [Sulfitobacter sp.]|uniref:hypothetical protein n=1 Tax=Sulfitobacter sp. TaxID=1903071 RepID=UPI003001B12C
MGQGQPLLRAALGDSVQTMTTPDFVTFYMEPELCQSAQAGKHNFIGKLANVVSRAGLEVQYVPFGSEGQRGGTEWSLNHIKSPLNERGLCFRRVYHYPFWQIEQSAERWSWDVAQTAFEPDSSDAAKAERFYKFWQSRLFGGAPKNTKKDGFVYVPLQGKLLDHRPFQICSPIEMVKHCLAQTECPVIATLHPSESYSASETQALEALEKSHARLTVQIGSMSDLILGCDYIVTQNSSVAFNGYLFGKPALLFRKTDFHHIAVQANLDDLAASFAEVKHTEPDYVAYLHWYWQKNSINAGRPEAEERIAARLRRFGWPV